MDALADIILDFALADWNMELPFAVNIVHPRPVPWTEISRYMRNALLEHGKRVDLKPASWPAWLGELQSHSRKNINSVDLVCLCFKVLRSAI